ncbi:MAG: beta-N-acetylhexosaminidase [Gammaproteobacteria bacterium]|nr:MAG: beta-N-acetylhexosaminidase [Gammaproteobacteria bacterium]
MRSTIPIGPLMTDIEGKELLEQEKNFLKQACVGGVILFARHYESPEQIKELIGSLRAAADKPLLVAVDHEGGRVQRFREGFSRLPPVRSFLDKTDCFDEALRLSELAGWLMAIELRSVGVDFSFAPVLDVDCGISEIIGDRSFSENPEQAGRLAAAYRNGMNRAGMAAVGKHFPGHGSVAPDSHIAIPEDDRAFELIEQHDLPPFKKLIDEGLEGIMPAHIIYRQIDDCPAGFSRKWIKQILRQQLGFEGVIFSDDLSMEGASCVGDYPQRARTALNAGCDMVLVCNDSDATHEVLNGNCLAQNGDESSKRLETMVGRFPVDREKLLTSKEWQQSVVQIEALL